MELLFYHAQIVTETKTIPLGYLAVKDGRIAAVSEGEPPQDMEAGERVDCAGRILFPGFVDLHCHGGGDSDFMDGTTEDILRAARAHLAHGTTTMLPTTLTCSDEELFLFFDQFEEARRVTQDMPRLPGVHLEGPYFSPAQAGAQPPQYLVTPRRAHYEEILRRSHGNILRWSIAPELEGAMALGDLLAQQGILVSIGHSDATYDVVRESLKHGYTHVTHLYSGMSTITRHRGMRVLGVVESAYLFDELHVELIADGIHLPPELLRLIVKTKDHAKISLVTDAMRGAGMPEGPSILGSRKNGQHVIIRDGIANMPDFNSFAGSVATTDRLVRTMVEKAGLLLHEAAAMMSLHPARLIHMEDEIGSIREGKRADLVLMDETLHASAVYVDGIRAFAERAV